MEAYSIHPKQTFWNLPAAKRERIVDAVVAEFSQNGYRRASLNAIVRQAGIAKGSLYQYFESKEHIFLFVFDRFTELVKDLLRKSIDEAGNDKMFWQKIALLFRAGYRFIQEYPAYYQLYLRVLFEHDIPERRELLERVRVFSADYLGQLIESGKQDGNVRPEVATANAVFLLDSILERFFQGCMRPYLDGGLGLADLGEHDLQQQIEQFMQIIKHGLSPGAKERLLTIIEEKEVYSQ